MAGFSKTDWFMPEESERHKRTWMAFGASEQIWGKRLLPEVRRNLAKIANTIVQFEPVTMLVRESDYEMARKLLSSSVELMICPLDDLWVRDTGPVFVVNEDGEKAAINFNFNGWGGKQEHLNDAQVASLVARQAGVNLINTSFVLEGGCIEVDGQGTAVITESCVLNDNRNPGL
jgi:agmatine deiminase